MATIAPPITSLDDFKNQVSNEYNDLLDKYKTELKFLLDTIKSYPKDNRIDDLEEAMKGIVLPHYIFSVEVKSIFAKQIAAKHLPATKDWVTKVANGMFASVYYKLLLYNYGFIIGKYLVGKGTANSDYIVKCHPNLTASTFTITTVAVKDAAEASLIKRDHWADYDGGDFTEILITEPITLYFDLDTLIFENFDTINDLDDIGDKCQVNISVSNISLWCNIKDIAKKIKSMIKWF